MVEQRSGTDSEQGALPRVVGLPGAVLLGLGSIVGTGVFVSIGLAAAATGPSVLLAIAVAAVVAACNGLSSAQLAARHPVSGGTYEYGYRWLTPSLGFTAGWMFLVAKSASAATAALGFAGYLRSVLHLEQTVGIVPLAMGAVVVVTALVSSGMRRTNALNTVIVSITLSSLVLFCLAGLPTAIKTGGLHWKPFFSPLSDHSAPLPGFLQACALMFVAFTGYGRIATLGEEVHTPSRTIPRAILITLLTSMLLYLAVGSVAVSVAGATTLAETAIQRAAPLESAASRISGPVLAALVACGAMTAMLGVLLNLILGLSRVVLAMGRRRDLPTLFGRISTQGTPGPAVVAVGLLILGLVWLGDIRLTWSYSAFSVLIYYALTNLASLRLPAADRLYPRIVSWGGLIACLGLAWWVDAAVWIAGLALLAGGLAWHWIWQSTGSPLPAQKTE